MPALQLFVAQDSTPSCPVAVELAPDSTVGDAVRSCATALGASAVGASLFHAGRRLGGTDCPDSLSDAGVGAESRLRFTHDLQVTVLGFGGSRQVVTLARDAVLGDLAAAVGLSGNFGISHKFHLPGDAPVSGAAAQMLHGPPPPAEPGKELTAYGTLRDQGLEDIVEHRIDLVGMATGGHAHPCDDTMGYR
eukprot:TRINITY_DN32100_c0_g1_i1.p1 TRINITY_DN32100_c0_g1~~TRINITY_DN32100_c0_g1_i1.p1  ORF type:complete len:224 (+),score=45.51 TRINITY_DN32100_c0_g1_i1:99-674(+)